MTLGRLHIDVTSLWERRAPPTGISRVVTELAVAVWEASPDNRAWRFDSDRRRMVLVPWPEFEGLLVRKPDRCGHKGFWSGYARRLYARTSKFLLSPFRRFSRRSGFPALTENDRFIFADFINDPRRIEVYRSLIEGTGVKTIYYCHDIIPILFPQFVSAITARVFSRGVDVLINNKTLVLANSDATMMDLAHLLKERGRRIEGACVIPLGCDISSRSENPVEKKHFGIDGEYILYVSTIEVRKNHRLLLEVYQQLLSEGRIDLPKLVFVGQRGWLVDDLLRELDGGEGASRHVVVLDDVADAELGQLYRGALFTVYPSFYEGWGIPIQEALAFGKFCLSSDRGALPQAGAGLVELLDPDDAALWAARIRHYLQDRSHLAAREELIRSRFQRRSWACFRRDVLEELTLEQSR